MAEAASVLGIHTYFLLTDVPRAEQRVERRLVSLAHMHLLHLGAHMDGDSGLIRPATASDKLVRQTVTLDLSPGNTSRIDRAALNLSRFTATLAQTPEYNSQLIRVKATAGMPEVLIPSATLFLFFWGISTTLINAVTSDHLHNPEMHLYNPANSDLHADPVRIEVRRQWTDDEALYLAALLKEPDAIDIGQQIFKAITASRMHQPRAPIPFDVWPPFARPLQVSGLFRQVGDYLLLTHILSVDLAQDWSALEIYREGGRRIRTVTQYDDTDEPPPEPPPPNGGSGIAPTGDVEVKETPGGWSPGAAEIPAVAALKARFPNLLDVEVRKPIDGDPVEQKKRTRRRISRGPWTAIKGRPLPRGGAIKGKIVGDETLDPGADASGTEEVETPFDDQLLKFRDLLLHSPKKIVIDGDVEVSLDFWDPYSGVAGADKPVVFKLPAKVDGELRTWLYRDPDCRRTKHGICVRLSAVDSSGRPHIRYLVDLERRVPLPRNGASDPQPISTGLMVIWFDEPQTSIDACINLQIVLADAARMRSTARLIRPMRGAHVATVRHRDAALAQTLASALAAPDQCLTPSSRAAVPGITAKA
ncbi:hypothetical protein CDO81_20745 [Roseateles puraquae]|uniref:Uncharacterized protein n=2 Tax=Roseateles puraquae TaxID=431059 RepID=A0A254N1U7_9BURK|nr:hypothetical protein CDO81_20745 [Roseateles puraquae]